MNGTTLRICFASETLRVFLFRRFQMTTTKELFASIEAQRDRQRFMALPIEDRVRNACPGCGCRLIEDFTRALAFVAGPVKKGRCQKCGWEGTK